MSTVDREELNKVVTTTQYFTMAFGTIVGVGWVIYLGFWLSPAGPAGAVLGFVLGTLMMMLIAVTYAETASIFPVSGGEMAYTYEMYGLRTSYLTGWLLALAYISVVAWEAISLAMLLETLFPVLRGPELYTVGSDPVYVGSIAIGMAGMAGFTGLHYLGIRWGAQVQNILTALFITASLGFIVAGIGWGEVDNLYPLFQETDAGRASVIPGILAVLMTAPYFLAGFDTIPQVLEEKDASTSLRSVGWMMVLAVGLAGVFYVLVIVSASMAMPWPELLALDELPAAAAFRATFDSPIVADLVLAAALLGLLTSWNAIFMAASRLLFALGRARMIPPAFKAVHSRFRSPTGAVLFVGAVGALGVPLGQGGLTPVLNMGVICWAAVFLLVCVGTLRMRVQRPDLSRPFRVPGGRLVMMLGVIGAAFFVFLSLRDPYVSAEGIPMEWALLAVWIVLGACFWWMARRVRNEVTENTRRQLIFGASLPTGADASPESPSRAVPSISDAPHTSDRKERATS
ncbi:MAG: amino acid permease [Bacteroidetes bacterium]|jgi:amino acid transporter|nr:amino acid permease [Bacteroidota bacterium]